MLTNLLPINTLTIRATGVSDRRKTTASATGNAGNNKWWGPIFGLSTDADYIDNKISAEVDTPAKTAKFTPGCFTEEKAKQLRLRTKESFHDVMYHSAIASRLASDFSGKERD